MSDLVLVLISVVYLLMGCGVYYILELLEGADEENFFVIFLCWPIHLIAVSIIIIVNKLRGVFK